RNGSNSLVSPKPKARRSFTPAPSIVGVDWTIRFTGRMDMACSSCCWSLRRCFAQPLGLARRQAVQQGRELVEIILQELSRAVVGNFSLIVDEPRLERDIGLAAHDQCAQRAAENLAEMLLRQRGRDGAGRGSRDGHRLAGPRVLPIGPCAPVDRVL